MEQSEASLSGHTLLCAYIARKDWWRSPAIDPQADEKRGRFYASTFAEAEFYGRPGAPERITVANPLVGDNDTIEEVLFGRRVSSELTTIEDWDKTRESRFELDAQIKAAATLLGYDSIVLMTPAGYTRYRDTKKIPRSLELNIFFPGRQVRESRRAKAGQTDYGS